VDFDTIGAIAIGLIVGYVSMMFIVRAVVTDPTAANLAKFLGVILAGTAVKYGLSQLSDGDDGRYGEYATGLGIGFVVYLVLYAIGHWGSGGNGGNGGPFPTINPLKY
jgi:hypothetical protein